MSFGNGFCRNIPPPFLRRRPGQRLGPNAGGGAKRGTGGCWWKRLVGVRLVAGIASGVAGCWFGVSGSWSRIRHQRAAAGWSSGRGPAAAADRTSWVASKPARVRLLNLSSSSGRNGSAVALGAAAASSRRHCRSGLVSAAASRLSSCCWKIRAARPSCGGPVGRRSLGSTWVAARHTCRSAISSAVAGVCSWAAQAGASAAALRRTWSVSSATRL